MDHGIATLELASGNARLVLAPGFGGTILRYASEIGARRIDWFRPTAGEPKQAGDTACFPLVPFSSRVRDSRFRFGGRTVELPRVARYGAHFRHGFGCLGAWDVAEQAADRAVLELRETGTSWPFPFRARQEFRLAPEALRVSMEITNNGREAMPAGLGLHPYFPRTKLSRVQAKVSGMWDADPDLLPTRLVTPPPADRDPGHGLMPARIAVDRVYSDWSRQARIDWPEHGASLTMTAERPLGFLVIYTPPNEDFFCVEPVTHIPDAFNLAADGCADTGMIVLEPGQSLGAAAGFAVASAR
ncbi:MAG: aldose 1-epimerase [Alphaproteobacteria bacterium]|nr:aldose 1-epimerase [Alphaproteobacteria bacterium]